MFLFARCLHLLVKIFIKVRNGLMTEVPAQNRSTSISSKLPTTACWFRKNVGKDRGCLHGDRKILEGGSS